MEAFQLLGRIALDNAGAIEAMDETSDKGDKTQKRLSSAFKKIGKAVSAYFAVSKIVDFGKAMVNLASDAETSAAKVNTLLKTGTDTSAYFDEMLDASTRTGVAMTEFSEATYGAMSAGVDQADAVGFVTDANKLAVGGFTDLTTSVDVLTTVMNGYGLSTEYAAHISDVLITTQNLGKTTVGELAGSIGAVIPIAAGYGVSLENVGAAYAVMTAGGIATSQSGTMMKSMFTELAKDGSKVSDILKKRTGKSFGDLMASGWSLADVLSLLYENCGNDSEAFANLWSSSEAGTGALAIVNAGTEEFNNTLQTMETTTGAVDEAYNTMMGTFAAKTNILKNTLRNAGTSIGKKFLPALGNIVDSITNWVQPAFEKFESYFDGVFGEDGSIDWDAMGNAFAQMFKDLGAKIPDILKALGDAIAKAWENGVWPMIQGLFKAAFGVDLPDWKEIMQKISGWWGKLQEKVDNICRAVFGISGGEAWEKVSGFFSTWWENIKERVKEIFTFGWKLANGELTWADVEHIFVNWWNSITEFVEGVFSAAWKIGENNQTLSDILAIFQAVWDSITESVSTIFSVVWGIASGEMTWEDVKDKFEEWWNKIKENVTKVFTAFFSLAGQAWEVLKPKLELWWTTIKKKASEIFTATINVIGKKWQEMKDSVSTWWSGVKSDVESAMTAAFNLLPPDVQKVINDIIKWWQEVTSKITLTLTAGWGGVFGSPTPDYGDSPYHGAAGDAVDSDGNANPWMTGLPTIAPQANGLDFVPRDGVLARLHYGEAVLNRTDAKNYRDGSGNAEMLALGDKLDAMLDVLQSGIGGSQQIVLDTGVLVGATVGMMDGQLGTRAARKGRGN